MNQDTERRQENEVHLLPVKQKRREKSVYNEKASEGGALTNCQEKRKEQVKLWRKSKRGRDTHKLSSIGGTSWDPKRR